MTDMTEEQYEALSAIREQHISMIDGPHRAAFAKDPVSEYKSGDVVWMFDHYNTALIVGPSDKVGRQWTVQTYDFNGTLEVYDYNLNWIRPADKEYVFKAE